MGHSLWEELQLEDKIFQILTIESYNPSHHFGRPFLTPYQIAIAFMEQFPKEFSRIGKSVGGKGAGKQGSLAQYFATELSRHICNGSITSIEGGFLHREHMSALQYMYGGSIIESSGAQTYDLAIFRRVD